MLRLVCVFILLLSIVGCGGNDDTIPNHFIPDTVDPGQDSISLELQSIGADHVVLEVKANQISAGVFSAVFDLKFDPAVLSFDGFEPGNFLEGEGDLVDYLIEPAAGRSDVLIAGISKRQGQAGSTGDGTIVTIRFKKLEPGLSPLTFENMSLIDLSGNEIRRPDQTEIKWYGATIVLN
jgi:hypothetical protein